MALLSKITDRWGYWLVLALAAATRLIGLGYPKALVFDETYYVKDAWTLSHLGYEGVWPAKANDEFVAGNVNVFLNDPSFVVHPPLGKWLIALGMNLFGAENTFSWRVSVAVAGVIGVALIMAVAKRLFGSKRWALLAGLLMSIDGLAIVMSRTAILDNFVMLFVLLAFYLLLIDRDRIKTRLQAVAADDSHLVKNIFWWRPFLMLTAISLGLATAVKWSGIYFAAAFGLYIVISEALLRRRLGLKSWALDGFVGQGLANLVLMVPIYVTTYLSTWTGWLITTGGWDRNWADSPDNRLDGLFGLLPIPLQSLVRYHQDAYGFHINLHTPHSYQSSPLTWLFMIRPVSFYYQGPKAGSAGCVGPGDCSEAITALGNPLIWWGAALAAFVVLSRYLVGIWGYFDRRGENYKLALSEDHRMGGLLLIGFVGGYLPWLLYPTRTVFQFYSIAYFAWMILCLIYVLKLFADFGAETESKWAIRAPRIFVILAVLLSCYFSNIWFGYQTPYWYWLQHMWLPSWI